SCFLHDDCREGSTGGTLGASYSSIRDAARSERFGGCCAARGAVAGPAQECESKSDSVESGRTSLPRLLAGAHRAIPADSGGSRGAGIRALLARAGCHGCVRATGAAADRRCSAVSGRSADCERILQEDQPWMISHLQSLRALLI